MLCVTWIRNWKHLAPFHWLPLCTKLLDNSEHGTNRGWVCNSIWVLHIMVLQLHGSMQRGRIAKLSYYTMEHLEIWNAVDRTARVNISLASDQLQQWQTGRKSHQAEHAPTMPSAEIIWWNRPPSGFMKCKHNAATFQEVCKTGVSAVIRDSSCEFMVRIIQCHHEILEAREAEAKALLEAVHWTISVELQHIILETDCK